MKVMFALLTLAALGASTANEAQQAIDPHTPGMSHAAPSSDAHGTGVIKAIDAAKGTVTLQHEAITTLGWPAMTMTFKVASPAIVTAKVGDRVNFELRATGMSGTVTSLLPVQP